MALELNAETQDFANNHGLKKSPDPTPRSGRQAPPKAERFERPNPEPGQRELTLLLGFPPDPVRAV